MGIGTSIFLLAVGAILSFAVTDAISGVDLTTVGYILMGAGVLGLLISLLVLNRPRRAVVAREPVAREPVVRERDLY
jgi:high-affinity nickel permease